MLIIRKEQMDIFEDNMIKHFEDRLVAHVNSHFPDKSRELGDEHLRTMINNGVQRAKIYKVLFERDIAKYVHLVFAFHEDFDKDPELPWAAQILNDDTLVGPSTRMECLFQESKKYLPGRVGS